MTDTIQSALDSIEPGYTITTIRTGMGPLKIIHPVSDASEWDALAAIIESYYGLRPMPSVCYVDGNETELTQ